MEPAMESANATVCFAESKDPSRYWDDIPDDLRKEVGFLIGDGNREIVEEALRCLLDKKKRRIPLHDVDPHNLEHLLELDIDKDGFLSYSEIVQGVKLLLKQKAKNKKLMIAFAIVLVCLLLVLGGVFGLVYVIVDLHKDTESLRGVLVDRSTRQPLQVASTELTIENGILTRRAAGTFTSLGSSGNETNTTSSSSFKLSFPITQGSNTGLPSGLSSVPDDGDLTIKTAQMRYAHDSIHSDMPNDVVNKIDHVTITGGPDSDSAMITAKVEGVVRVPSGSASILLLFTTVGRFVVNGTDIKPARGDLDTKSLDELYQITIISSTEQTLSMRRALRRQRRGITSGASDTKASTTNSTTKLRITATSSTTSSTTTTAPTTRTTAVMATTVTSSTVGTTAVNTDPQVITSNQCNAANACKPRKGRRDEAECCIGQLFQCNFQSSPQKPKCDPNNWCVSVDQRDFSFQCSDLSITLGPGGGGYAGCDGTYVIYATTWNGFPVYYNKPKSRVMLYNKDGRYWIITSAEAYFGPSDWYQGKDYFHDIGGFVWNKDTDLTKNWGANYIVSYTGSTGNALHCPGSQQPVPAPQGSDPATVYYPPPYLRMCAPGHFCQTTTSQLLCDDLIFTVKPGREQDDYASCSGTYVLQTSADLKLNGFPIYINKEKNRFLGRHPWNVWQITSVDWQKGILAEQPSNWGAFNGQADRDGNDPKVGWRQYDVTYAGSTSKYADLCRNVNNYGIKF